ncbi:phasin family protein [Hellea balneolensis]|uniref:phasin family protein n=1 Tax=Hellea balneolensis TaxID=287478 RepID=UPI00040F6F17|nr:phasin family protein [Hellea balneolensis]
MTDKKKRSSTESARRIWLAGIGAYGRAFTEAQEALKDVTGKGSEVFDELVQKGEMLEMVGKAKGKEALEKAQMPSFDMPDFDIDDRIKAMRSRLSRGSKDEGETAGYEDRLSAIEAKLDRILDLLEPKKPARKKPVKRATTARTKKPAAKTTAAKKPTTKK